eukprot:14250109-Heterocapsa_arctica.AAC.1
MVASASPARLRGSLRMAADENGCGCGPVVALLEGAGLLPLTAGLAPVAAEGGACTAPWPGAKQPALPAGPEAVAGKGSPPGAADGA